MFFFVKECDIVWKCLDLPVMLQIKNDWQQSGWTCDFSADCSLLHHKFDNWRYREFYHGCGNIQINVSVIKINFTLSESEDFDYLAMYLLDSAVWRICSINLDIFHTDINILHSVTDFHWLFALTFESLEKLTSDIRLILSFINKEDW